MTEDEEVFECPVCGKEYESEYWFNKHVENCEVEEEDIPDEDFEVDVDDEEPEEFEAEEAEVIEPEMDYTVEIYNPQPNRDEWLRYYTGTDYDKAVRKFEAYRSMYGRTNVRKSWD